MSEEEAEQTKWEYKTAPLEVGPEMRHASPVDRMNELGEEGWELVTTAAVASGVGPTGTTLLIFKRPVGSGEGEGEE